MSDLINQYQQNPEMVWLVAGGILLLLEVSIIPGIGLMFAGLAALSLGGLLTFDVLTHEGLGTEGEVTIFLAFTVIWALILWKPLKNSTKSTPSETPKNKKFLNLIGTTAEVTGVPLKKTKASAVIWSGTRMQARLAASAKVNQVEVGDTVRISNLEGSVLIVTPMEQDAGKLSKEPPPSDF